MPKLKNFNVYVTVNGQKLAEFNDDDEDNLPSNTVTKFIEVVSNKEFKVEFHDEENSRRGCDGMRCSVSLDGKEVDVIILEFSKRCAASSDGARTRCKGIWTVEKYSFQDIVQTEQASNSSKQDMKKLIDNLGTITVQLYRVKNIRISDSGNDSNVDNHVSSKSIPAKYLKGLPVSHKASLGPPQAAGYLQTVHSDRIDPRDCPFAVFKFKYRSRKDLQDLLIIPRPATPVPLEERPKNELTREELLELLNRHPVKREPLSQSEAQISVKRERDPEYDELISTAKTRKVTRTEKAIEVIDLLD